MKDPEYIDFTKRYNGTLKEVHEGGVVVDIDDRMGRIMVPMRMVISDEPLRVGQKVALNMSYIEQI
jgi:hypothetical protein